MTTFNLNRSESTIYTNYLPMRLTSQYLEGMTYGLMTDIDFSKIINKA